MEMTHQQKPIRIGTRGSDLAVFQSNLVASALEKVCKRPSELVRIQSSGDLKRNAGEHVARDKKDWIVELERMLIDGSIDLAIHSAKDVPVDIEAETRVVSVLEREDPRDALLIDANNPDGLSATELLKTIGGEGVIGSASKRRRAQMLRLGLAGSVKTVRGNVPTRIQKMKEQSDLDGLVLAYSGLRRLGLEKEVSALFEIEEMLPAVHQGTLCAQYLSGNSELETALREITEPRTQLAWEAERGVIEKLGADCESCVAVYAWLQEEELCLRAQVLSSDGSRLLEESKAGSAGDAKGMGHEVGESLLRAGAADLL